MEQLILCATTRAHELQLLKPKGLESVLNHKRSQRSEKPVPLKEE